MSTLEEWSVRVRPTRELTRPAILNATYLDRALEEFYVRDTREPTRLDRAIETSINEFRTRQLFEGERILRRTMPSAVSIDELLNEDEDEDEDEDDLTEEEREDQRLEDLAEENANIFSEVYALRDAAKRGETPKQEETDMGIKKYEEQTLEDIKLKEGSFFLTAKYKPLPDAGDDENKLLIKETINFLETAAQALQVPILKIPMLSNFATEDNRLQTDRGKLNRRLLEIKKGIESPEWRAKSLINLAPEITKLYTDGVVGRLRRDKEKLIEEVQTCHSNLQSNVDKMREFNLKHGDFDKLVFNDINKQLMSVLNAVANNPFYTFIGFNKLGISLLTQEIELRDYNPSASLDLTVNLGTMIVFIPFSGSGDGIRVERGKNTILTSNYHPHVSSNGVICWGNASQIYPELLVSGQYDKLLVIIQSLLCTYNSSDPYNSLNNINRADKSKGRSSTDKWIDEKLAVTTNDIEDYNKLPDVIPNEEATIEILAEELNNTLREYRPAWRIRESWRTKNDKYEERLCVINYMDREAPMHVFLEDGDRDIDDTYLEVKIISSGEGTRSKPWYFASTCKMSIKSLHRKVIKLKQHPLWRA